MKKLMIWLLMLCLVLCCAAAEQAETLILLGDDVITVNGAPIGEDAAAAVYLKYVTETHEDVPEELRGVQNRVVTITDAGVYRLSGSAQDVQIAVCAGDDDDVRLILDGVSLSCRTASAIAVYSARDPRTAGEYGVTIELAAGSGNYVTGSHNAAMTEDEPEFDGAIGSQVSLGFEGEGSLTVDADNEGVEVASGHLTINGGVFEIQACDDPLNVSEDGVGVLTMNAGYVYSAVKNLPGGEGDGIDSNGWIVFNGGTAINLAHPASQDGGIDSDMGSTINGGVIVGAGNMYDPIETASGQLFMMLEFSESTDDLVVVTDAAGTPVFAYDFPYDYMYIAFSTPDLKDGETYYVYLGGEITGTQTNGLYTDVTAYTPGRQLMHGGGVAEQRAFDPMQGMTDPMAGGQAFPGQGGMTDPMGGFGGMQQAPGGRGGMQSPGNMGGMQMPGGDMAGMQDMAALMEKYQSLDLNELLRDADLNELLKDVDLNDLLTGVPLTQLLTEEQLRAHFGDQVDLNMLSQLTAMTGGMGGMMAPRSMASSADVATTRFVLTKDTCTFSNITAVDAGGR